MPGQTIIEKIISKHLTAASKDTKVKPGAITDIMVDVRAARDFGGANVVKNLIDSNMPIDDVKKTFFTFDCNPTGSDQKYAVNQHICRLFARENDIKVFDIEQGIGTHGVIESNTVVPGGVFVSTDSHANIMGSIGAFGQGMGDVDIAATFANGSIWFKVPKSCKVILKGMPKDKTVLPKDITLAMNKYFGANGLLGYSAELYGEYVDQLNLSGRISIASMGTEMGAIIILIPPNEKLFSELGIDQSSIDLTVCVADNDCDYDKVFEIDITNVLPHVSRPGHPDDAISVKDLKAEKNHVKIDSAFVGSCTNGRIEDMRVVASILKGRKVAPEVVLKIVPSTKFVYEKCLAEGLIDIFVKAGALVGNPGCAGCAAGQIGQNGMKEVTISSGNRNFAGKQGKGDVYLASPATVAAAAIAGFITEEYNIPNEPDVFSHGLKAVGTEASGSKAALPAVAPMQLEGKAWVIDIDNIDTDMIFHNAFLQITNIDEMVPHTFGNLPGWEHFPKEAQPGDILVIGKNFGCGSSRQQAVDCFKGIGITCLIGKSFGAIYERNAINAGLPMLVSEDIDLKKDLTHGDIIKIDLEKSTIFNVTKKKAITCLEFNPVQKMIYKRGGLLKKNVQDW